VARFFKVHPCTIYEWRATIREFSEAMKIGKAVAADRVERSFYQRACGYEYDSRKIVTSTKNGVTVTETSEHVPGDVTAQMKWLCNRMPRMYPQSIKTQPSVTSERAPIVRGCFRSSRIDGSDPIRVCVVTAVDLLCA
jgi:hypothetical protein